MDSSNITEAELTKYESLALPLIVHLHPRELLRLTTEVRDLQAKLAAHGPRYEHDCKVCVFLGQCGDDDLYFCPPGEHNPSGSLVARSSDNGADFASQAAEILQELLEFDSRVLSRRPLTIAYHLAQAKGLITPPPDKD